MNYLKKLWFYIRFRQDINHYYWYSLKEGFCDDESYSWLARTDYWAISEINS